MDDGQTKQGIEQILGVVRRRALVVVLCFVLAAGAAYGFAKHETKKYTATASLAFSYNSLSQQIAGLSASSAGSLLTQQASNLELVKLGDMAEKTARLLGHGLTAEKVSQSLSISGQGESAIVVISATAASSALAADIANTYAQQFVVEQQSSNSKFLTSALALVKKQLTKLSPAARFGPDGLDLEDRAQTLSLLAELGYNNAQVAQEALAPASPSSPKTKTDTFLGAAVGLLLGLGLAFALERLDRRIREPEDLGALYGLPMLGAIPRSAALSRTKRRDRLRAGGLPFAEAEAFSLVRAHLRFFNVDRELRTLVIASPVPGEGKTTIARHLAEAAARLGSRVLLLELDLRRPTLASQLEISSGAGLAGVLIGAISMDAAVETVNLQASPGEGIGRRTLDVLVAGAVLPPNPGELLESHGMDVVLERASAMYDLVVVDSPPLMAVSDAFPLLTKVDGVIIVGWVGRSRRDDAEQLRQVLVGSGAPLLGVIANGAKTSGPGSYSVYGKGKTPSAVASATGDRSSEGAVAAARE
jgi:succinoglycan biosynthesis transport protein ExoP